MVLSIGGCDGALDPRASARSSAGMDGRLVEAELRRGGGAVHSGNNRAHRPVGRGIIKVVDG